MPDDTLTPCSSRSWRASLPQVEPVLYSALVLLHLVPIWVFPYVPTQDGPAHLANAIILKDHGTLQTRYHEFFDLCWEPFPNWTSQLLLAGLLYAFPPLVAHKVLVSLYVVGFAFAFRYFLGSFGTHALRLAPAGLLFIFNRCFLMGFYNYCLSLLMLWVALGYCLRRRQSFGLGDAAVLMAFLWLAYFTHLLGYLLAGASAAWVLATSPPHRLRKLACVAVSALPTAWLAAHSLVQPAVLGLREHTSNGLPWLRAHIQLEHWWQELQGVNQGLFEPYAAWKVPMDLLVLLFYEALLVAMLIAPGQKPEQGKVAPPRLPIALFGVGIGVLYVVLPDFLSVAIGFLKARLIILPPLLWLACLRMPQQVTIRRVMTGFLYLLVGMNLILVNRYFQAANREIAEYTAGVNYVGHNRTLFVVQSRAGPQRVSYLEHAANYYCLPNRNVNLDNYQADLKHFPVRFRSGIARGRESFPDYANRDLVDVILVWDAPFELPPDLAGPYREIYQGGCLRLFARATTKSTENSKERQAETKKE